jgi:hypothetical protein
MSGCIAVEPAAVTLPVVQLAPPPLPALAGGTLGAVVGAALEPLLLQALIAIVAVTTSAAMRRSCVCKSLSS